MAKLRCDCLNICISTQGIDLKKLTGKSFLRTDSEDDFFKSQIYEVQLGVAGIQKVSYLHYKHQLNSTIFAV